MSAVIGRIAILARLFQLYVRSRMEYRGAFILNVLAQIITYGATFAVIWLLLLRFGDLAGWQWDEMALLFSFQLLAYALGAACSFTQFRDLEDLVRKGTFDALLVKPISPLAYLICSGINIGYVAHILLASGMLLWAAFTVQVAWTPLNALYLLVAIVNAAVIYACLMIMIGAAALIFVRSHYLFTIFFGFWELSRYPLTIFPGAIQVILLTAVPLGFTGYVPVAYLLGKEIALVGDAGGVLTLVVGPTLVLLTSIYWRFALSRYQSGGG